MIIDTVYNIFDKVKINDIETTGTITEITISSNQGDIKYYVEYFWEGLLQTVWLRFSDISCLKPDMK